MHVPSFAGDIWALGVILHACLTGFFPYPYDNPSPELFEAIMSFRGIRLVSFPLLAERSVAAQGMMASRPRGGYQRDYAMDHNNAEVFVFCASVSTEPAGCELVAGRPAGCDRARPVPPRSQRGDADICS